MLIRRAGNAWNIKSLIGLKFNSSNFTLATGSPGELGLLEALAKEFNATQGTTMCWVKAGSGKSLKLLETKQVDIVMVHAPAAEKKAMADGWAIKRSLIGANEFYIVGPKNDPAKIATATSAADAYAKIASSKANFLSRGTQFRHPQKRDAHMENRRREPHRRLVYDHQGFHDGHLEKSQCGQRLFHDRFLHLGGREKRA